MYFVVAVSLVLRKILALRSTYSVTRFLLTLFRTTYEISSNIRNFVRYLKILIFLNSKAAWEYRRDHAINHSSGERVQI